MELIYSTHTPPTRWERVQSTIRTFWPAFACGCLLGFVVGFLAATR